MTNEYLAPTNPAKPIENTISFFNTMSGDNVEVLRISKDGITANPDVPVDEAAQAILRALDGYIKQLTQRTWVGLTEQEAAECWSTSTVRTWQSIEAKLKELNT